MGIENLKKLIDFLFSSASVGLTIDRDGDGRLEFGEIFAALSGSLILQIPRIFSSFPEIKAEFKDLTAEELEQLAQHCQEKDYLPAQFDGLEEFIKKTLLWISYNGRYFEYSRDFFTPSK